MKEEKIIGNIDNIAIAVRGIEETQEFLSDLLDTEFTELTPSGAGNDDDSAQKSSIFGIDKPKGLRLHS